MPALRLTGGGGGGLKGSRGSIDPLRAFALNVGRNKKVGLGRKG